MADTRQTIDDFLSRARLALDNARAMPDLLAALTTYGYDETVLQQGITKLETARRLQATHSKEYGEQMVGTNEYEQAFELADQQLRVHRRLMKLALRDDPDRRRTLRLNERAKRDFPGWEGQAHVLYTNLLDDSTLLDRLARFKVTRAHVQQAHALVQDAIEANERQEREKSEAQAATKTRDAALDDLGDWMVEFRAIAKLALAGRPQQLEALQFGPIP